MIDNTDRDRLRVAVAAAIRKLRRDKGIAQEKLALESGTDRTYMSALERGLHSASLETIWKLLPHLGIDFARFGAEVDRNLHRPPKKKNEGPHKQKPQM